MPDPTVSRILALVALLLAIASFAYGGPLVAVAVILLAVAVLIA